jgi:hypothetical protein
MKLSGSEGQYTLRTFPAVSAKEGGIEHQVQQEAVRLAQPHTTPLGGTNAQGGPHLMAGRFKNGRE